MERNRASAFAVIGLLLLAVPAQAQVTVQNGVNRQTALSNTAATIKSSKGLVAWLSCYNVAAAVTWIQFYDTTSAVVVGTTTPKMSIPIKSADTLSLSDLAASFTSAIKVAATTTMAGGSAPASAVQCSFGFQ